MRCSRLVLYVCLGPRNGGDGYSTTTMTGKISGLWARQKREGKISEAIYNVARPIHHSSPSALQQQIALPAQDGHFRRIDVNRSPVS